MHNIYFLLIIFLISSCSYISGPDGFFPETADDFFNEEIAEDLKLPSSSDNLELKTDNHYPYLEARPEIDRKSVV